MKSPVSKKEENGGSCNNFSCLLLLLSLGLTEGEVGRGKEKEGGTLLLPLFTPKLSRRVLEFLYSYSYSYSRQSYGKKPFWVLVDLNFFLLSTVAVKHSTTKVVIKLSSAAGL